MHIDGTFIPLGPGKLLVNPKVPPARANAMPATRVPCLTPHPPIHSLNPHDAAPVHHRGDPEKIHVSRGREGVQAARHVQGACLSSALSNPYLAPYLAPI